jgi:predicted enzyme related to lactoylglutathione lyase
MALPERWFRTRPDSSVLARPRLLARSLIDVSELDDAIAFYEWLLGEPADLRMPIPDFGGLELAAVGNLLLIASSRPFTPIQHSTAYSLIVPSLDEQLAALRDTGTEVLEPPEAILPGARARVRYPDGAIAELVEHRPQPGEQARPARAPGPATGIRLLARRAVPAGRLDEAIARYESVLRTEAGDRITPGAPTDTQLVVVGDLCLIGSDELSVSVEPIEFALLTSSASESAARTIRNGSRPTPAGILSDVDDRSVVRLASGVWAELWNLP